MSTIIHDVVTQVDCCFAYKEPNASTCCAPRADSTRRVNIVKMNPNEITEFYIKMSKQVFNSNDKQDKSVDLRKDEKNLNESNNDLLLNDINKADPFFKMENHEEFLLGKKSFAKLIIICWNLPL